MPDQRQPRVLLLGSRGQVGWELSRTLAPMGDVRCFDRAVLDLSDLQAVRAALDANAADVIVNAAAYTHVDRAESDSAMATRLNADLPEILAAHAKVAGALLVHYSTDYVFDGNATQPYVETDATAPQNVYGASKLQGDSAVLSSEAAAYIFRIGWVYGMRGRNFLRTVQQLAAKGPELRMVADQTGSPTWSRAIAETTAQAIGAWLRARREHHDAPPSGVYHMASPDYATWHEFATAIVEASLPTGARPMVRAITTAEFPTPARRPARSVLDSTRLRTTFGLALPPWRDQLSLCVDGGA